VASEASSSEEKRSVLSMGMFLETACSKSKIFSKGLEVKPVETDAKLRYGL
jgi:hypothetical protein